MWLRVVDIPLLPLPSAGDPSEAEGRSTQVDADGANDGMTSGAEKESDRAYRPVPEVTPTSETGAS
jgi:hypothetical protein